MKKFLIALLGVGLSFTMVACGDDTNNDNSGDVALSEDEKTVAAAKTRLVITALENDVIGSFSLVTAGYNGTEISYVSSNSNVISIDGEEATVTRPAAGEADVTVTITATLTKGTATDTKVFTALVLALPEAEEMTIAEMIKTASSGDSVLLKGVYVQSQIKNGSSFYLTDGVTTAYYYGSIPTGMEVGVEYDLQVTYSPYGYTPQISEIVIKETYSAPTKTLTPTAVTVAEMNALSASTSDSWGYYSLTGIVKTDSSNYYLTNLDGDLVSFHYNCATDRDLLKDFEGKEINLNVYINYYYSSGSCWYVFFNDSINTVTVTNPNPYPQLTDTEAVAAAKDSFSESALNSSITTDFTVGTTNANDVVISYESSNTNVLSFDGGAATVTRPAATEEDATVKVTVTFTRGEETDTLTVEVKVLKMPVITTVTIAEYYEGAKNDWFLLENVVVVGVGTRGYYVTDGTNNMFISTYYDSTNTPSSSLLVGTKINLTVQKSSYYNQVQGISSSFEVVSNDNSFTEVTTTLTILELKALNDAVSSYYSTAYTLTGTVVSESDNYYLEDASGNRVQIHYHSNATSYNVIKTLEGAEITLTLYMNSYNSSTSIPSLFFYGTLEDITVVTE